MFVIFDMKPNTLKETRKADVFHILSTNILHHSQLILLTFKYLRGVIKRNHYLH